MWYIDIRHWLNDEKTGPGAPQLKSKVVQLAKIITFATARDSDLLTGDPPKCSRRPNRRSCKGRLNIHFTEDDRIYWICPVCGDEGVVDGWHGLIWDVSVYEEKDLTVH
ncbi:MAG: hypothetical protein A2511_15485 [Deltaproteobacteria bacterium RIFOXYD12_FULL_50_9]|nr:MAG: hypothetical protein A2511_15485 [Deltaproteobacteria bacterium RIFOXYD12_FULL_50_9]